MPYYTTYRETSQGDNAIYCMEIRKVFKTLLRQRNHSFAELSKKSGVPTRTIQEWYYHDREPSLFTAEKVLVALGYRLTIEKIEGGEEK